MEPETGRPISGILLIAYEGNTMAASRTALKDIDEYIARFPLGVREILKKNKINHQKSGARRAGKDQLSDTDLHSTGQSGAFCRF